MVRRAAVETRSLIQRFSEATQKRRSWRFGRKRRRVLFMACETLLPVVVRLPVTWHTRDIRTSKGNGASLSQGGGGPTAKPAIRPCGARSGCGFSGCRRRVGIVLPDPPGPGPAPHGESQPYAASRELCRAAATFATPRVERAAARGNLNAPKASRAANPVTQAGGGPPVRGPLARSRAALLTPPWRSRPWTGR